MDEHGIEQVTASEWRRWIRRHGGIVLDVREPTEWAQGTLPGAERISLREIPAAARRLDPETPMLLVCRSGNRSQVAAAFLARNGFARVANLAGGLQALGLAA